MSALTDFNDPDHRTASASVVLQKGIYHLFILKNQHQADVFAYVLRMYQCLYQLCSAMLLLDEGFDLNKRTSKLPKPLKGLCKDPKNPTRDRIDPSAVLTHDIFHDGAWTGFPAAHSMHGASKKAVALCKRVVEARHIVVYRPMLLAPDGWCWDDCPLFDYVSRLPRVADVELVYRECCSGLVGEFHKQTKEQERIRAAIIARTITDTELVATPRLWAIRFFHETLKKYPDTKNVRPTETILLSYARLFHGESDRFLEETVAFQDELLNLGHVKEALNRPFHAQF